MNKYKIVSFDGQANMKYWLKTLLDDLPGRGEGGIDGNTTSLPPHRVLRAESNSNVTIVIL